MDRAVMLYTTFPSLVEAEKAGKALVEDRLAACVNILPGMISHYRWQGAVERAEEAVMLIKTRASLAGAGARRGQSVASLRHAGDSRAADRERRRDLPRLDHGFDEAGRGLTRRAVAYRPRGGEIPLSTRSRPKKVRRMNGRQRRRSRRFM